MAILSPTNYKGFEVTAYVSLEHFQAQKQINREPVFSDPPEVDQEGNPIPSSFLARKLWTVTADVFIWKEPEKINLLETKCIHTTVEALDGLTVSDLFEKIKESYPGEDC